MQSLAGVVTNSGKYRTHNLPMFTKKKVCQACPWYTGTFLCKHRQVIGPVLSSLQCTAAQLFLHILELEDTYIDTPTSANKLSKMNV